MTVVPTVGPARSVVGGHTLAAEEHRVVAHTSGETVLTVDGVDVPRIVVLPRSSSRGHIADNLAAASIELTEQDRASLAALPKDHRTNDPPFAPDWD